MHLNFSLAFIYNISLTLDQNNFPIFLHSNRQGSQSQASEERSIHPCVRNFTFAKLLCKWNFIYWRYSGAIRYLFPMTGQMHFQPFFPLDLHRFFVCDSHDLEEKKTASFAQRMQVSSRYILPLKIYQSKRRG